MSTKQNLNFHRTFAPEREYLSKLLELAYKMPPMTKEEIFQQTGIPTGKSSGKVDPHIRYAISMGLLTGKIEKGNYVLERTPFGELVYGADPHLLEPITLMVCHFNICSKTEGAVLWQFLFNKAIPYFGLNIEQDSLANAAAIEFKVPKVNLTPLRVCYSTEKCFSSLGLLEISSDKTWFFNSISYKSNCRYAYAYTLLKTWEKLLPERKELTVDELTSELGWNTPFGWDERAMLNVLDSLSDMGILSLNKQLSPITIIRKSGSDSVLPRLYSFLL